MAQIDNYTSSKTDWLWTGRYTLNQIWSYFRVDEPIIVNSIEVYWGGYSAPTSGKHFIAKWTSGDGKKLGSLIVTSDTIKVPQGRGWRKANCKPTLLEPGVYAVGLWGDHLENRTVGMWNGDGGNVTYLVHTTKISGNVTGKAWDGAGKGVLPCRLNYEPAGRVKIKISGSWRNGQVWVKVSNSWRKAKSVWVKVSGTWRRSK